MDPAASSTVRTLDDAPLTLRFGVLFGTLCASAMLEFFDIYIVGFLVTAIAPEWKMTFFQAGLILLSAGVGAVVGGALGGALADRFGRKTVVVWALMLTGLASALVGGLPDKAWLAFAALRFFVGLGQGAMGGAQIALNIEWTPLRHRTALTTLQGMFSAGGVLAASIVAAGLLDAFGWRMVALLGIIPVITAGLIVGLVPESPRWLLSRGRIEAAREATRKVFGIELGATLFAAAQPAIRFGELFAYPRQVALIVVGWICCATVTGVVFSWGPTLLSQLLGVTPGEAAAMFGVISVAAVAGGFVFAVIASLIGRSGAVRYGFLVAAVLAVAAAYAGPRTIGDTPLFLICLALITLTLSGVASNLAPYSGELWPARLAGRGAGLGQAASGIGRITGPATLALIAGSGNLVAPRATSEAIVPTFLVLAALAALAGGLYAVIRIETHRRPIKVDTLDTQSLT